MQNMNYPLLTQHQGERAELIQTARSLAAAAEAAERSLTTEEETLIREIGEKVDTITGKIQPLEAMLKRDAENAETRRLMDGISGADSQREADSEENFLKRFGSPGEFISERARSIDSGDTKTMAMFTRAIAHEKIADVPGLVPKPIVQPLINWLDASRPVTRAFTERKMPAKGASFDRPKVTQHTAAGVQTAEKTDLATQTLKVELLNAPKKTIGGALNLSRQVIDWTEPSALDVVIADLIGVIAVQSETLVTTQAIASAAGQKVAFDVAGATVKPSAMLKALADSAVKIHAGTTRLPNRVIASIDVWAALKAITYASDGRSMLDPATGEGVNNAGTSEGVGSFSATLDGLPLTVAATAPAGTFIVADSLSLEVFEDIDRLLRMDEPKIAGLEIAMYTYMAALEIEAKGFVTLAKTVA